MIRHSIDAYRRAVNKSATLTAVRAGAAVLREIWRAGLRSRFAAIGDWRPESVITQPLATDSDL